MRQQVQALVVLGALLITSRVFAADTYVIDPHHTSFSFMVKHMMISNVPGEFDKFNGTVTYDPKDLAASRAEVTIDAASIDTRVAMRDADLKSPHFFDVAKYPVITFVATKFTPGYITGDLTMKGLTKRITIPVTIAGPVNEMGHQAIGITGTTTINRQDWGISWNKTLDQGGVAVSNDVLLTISIEADRK
ncbi:MAG: YceI family protein [Candidatus Omnitrophica bacterium]|nr:YceI family protein [Candidatus Omnitrophota bacterium]